jgi:hypothetical protein
VCVKPLFLNSMVGVLMVSMVQKLVSCAKKQAKDVHRN